jgi:sporulation protein YlmC with PRC-barrel domain
LLVIPFQSVQEINEIIIKNQNRKVLLDEAQVNQMCGFVMEVLHEDSIPAGHVEQLKDILSDLQIDTDVGMVSYTSITGHKMNVLYKEKGWFQEATVDWGYGVETPRIMMTGADFKQPEWPSGKGYGRIPFLEVDGNVMDFEESWPLFEGESIKMKNKILDIQLSGEIYKVDFSNEVPRFSK